jgi:hypothetical protein
VTAGAQLARADAVLQRSMARRRAKQNQYVRFETTQPMIPAPPLHCPFCDRPLAYLSSQIGGVSDAFAEQWDYYSCPGACGQFQYRHRSRKLRAIPFHFS